MNRTIDILKEAILLEMRGQAFCRNVAQQSPSAQIKESIWNDSRFWPF